MRRILILMLAWLSFDLATPLPGAFEFEADDSEIEESIHRRRQSGRESAADSARATPRELAERPRAVRATAPRASPARRPAGDEWLAYLRLAHLPSSGRAQTSEAH